MKMTYGETTKQIVKTVYRVETNFPTADPERMDSNDRFGTYYTHAYTDKRDPGHRKSFLKSNPEIEGKMVRGESWTFYDALNAFVCAESLRQNGVIACRYENSSSWNVRDRGLPLKVRVVEYHTVEINRVCEPSA